MAIPIIAAVAAITQLLTTIKDVMAAGKTEITDEQMDGLFTAIAASDTDLSDAITRARARESAAGGE